MLSPSSTPLLHPLPQNLESRRRKGPRMKGNDRIWGGPIGTGPLKHFLPGKSTRPAYCGYYLRKSEGRTMIVSLAVSISPRDVSFLK